MKTGRIDWKKFLKLFSGIKFFLILYTIIALAISLQHYLLPPKSFGGDSPKYTKYNNYVIFKQSANHLVHNQDLYKLYPDEHWDLYKYSPVFALGFSVFAFLPDYLGLILWNLLNAIILLVAIWKLPLITHRAKGFMLFALLPELVTSLQNSQSNALMAGLLILAFVNVEKGNYLWSTLFIVISVYIKLFGLVGFALFLFYPEKMKSALYSFFWILLLFVLPLPVTGFNQLVLLYQNWWKLLVFDESASWGLSVMGLLTVWSGYPVSKTLVAIAGVVVFCLPFVLMHKYKFYNFRLLALSSVLIWVVIFNHKAESPTYIIAMAGVVIWFFTSERNWFTILLFVIAIVLTSLSPTDLFPVFIRDEVFSKYVLKAFPCILIWLTIIITMLKVRKPLVGRPV